VLTSADRKRGRMPASKSELVAALDELILKTIEDGRDPQKILELAEARAWLVVPGQSHGSRKE